MQTGKVRLLECGLLLALLTSTVVAAPLPIVEGDVWRYFKGTAEPSPGNLTAWTTVGFTDTSWLGPAPSGFGYGDPGFATVLSDMMNTYWSVYIRKTFDVADPGLISALTLTVDFDDAYVCYINGTEVARSRVSETPNITGTPPPYNQAANPGHESSYGAPPGAVQVDSPSPGVLVAGVNVIACQGHNQTLGSSDFALVVELSATIAAGIPDEPTLVAPPNGGGGVSVNPMLTAHVSDPDSDPLDVTFFGREADGAPAEDFTVVHLGDTQHYASSFPGTFTTITQWIRDRREELNIVYAAASGDIVNTATVVQEWQNADAAYSILEPPLGPDFLDGIPYGIIPGNHDQDPNGSADGTQNFNQYFGIDRFLGRSYYGGNFNSIDNDNNYTLFTASGMDFISVNLEYDGTPDPSVLAWADTVLQAFSDRRAIVVTHYFIEVGEQAPWGTQGFQIYNAVMDRPNVFLMLCGHRHGEGKRVDTAGGNTIYTLVSDYQDYPNGGNGWIRLLQFSPAASQIQVRTVSPWLTQANCTHTWVPAGGSLPAGCYQQDADSEFVIPYEMDGSPFLELGTNSSVASGTNTSWMWSGLTPAKEYEWYVTVSDGTNSRTGATWTFTTVCSNAGECGDGNPCTTDDCVSGACVHTPANGAPCDDGDACTAGEACAAGACQGGTPTSCPVGASCDPDSGLCLADPVTITFQQGVGGYAGIVDTFVNSGAATANNGAISPLVIDGDPTIQQGLVRFDNIFGGGGGIPLGATIVSADLTLNVSNDSTTGASFHRMLAAWTASSNWNSFGGNGVQANGVEAVATADASSMSAVGLHTVDVTVSVQAWAGGATNLGWALLPNGTDSWQFHSAEGATPPRLEVTYLVCLSSADCDDGDPCDGAETCDVGTGACQPGTPIDCGSQYCNPANGSCVECLSHVQCDDANFCNGVETCDSATFSCTTGTVPNCEDGLACTVDSCDMSLGCQNVDTCPVGQRCTSTGCQDLPDLAAGDVIIAGFNANGAPEWLELFNTTDQPIPLDELTIVSRVDTNSDGTLEEDWRLVDDTNGRVIAPHSFFLIGETGVTPGPPDVSTDLKLTTNEGGSTGRAIGIEVAIAGIHMDHLLYGRHDGSTPAGQIPPGDIPFAGFGGGSGGALVAAGSVWKYLDNGSNQGTAWRDPLFADGAWASGPAELGYGDAPATTVYCGPSAPTCTSGNYITTYFRRSFDVTDPSTIASLTLRLQRDDGAVVYLNGTEVRRDNLPAAPAVISSTTTASATVSGADESTFFASSVDPALLVAGTNVLAVEVHQQLAASSDVSFDLELLWTASPVERSEVVRTVTAPVDAFNEGVTQRLSAQALYAGHAVLGFYTDEAGLPGSYPDGVWTSRHATTGTYTARNSATPPVDPPFACDDDGDCTDGLVCNGVETCDVGTGTCVPGTPVVCNDSIACTTDACVEPGGACQYTPNHAACDDSNVCTDDACVIGTGCVSTPNTAPCNDGNACTLTDTCSGRNCVGSGTPNCDDGIECTDDSCIPASGCAHADNCTGGQVCNHSTGVCETLAYPPLPIEYGDAWRFFKGTAEPTPGDLTAWRQIGFDDSTWLEGPSGFGFDHYVETGGTNGNGDYGPFIGTELSDMRNCTPTNPPLCNVPGYASVYMRKSFTVTNPAAVVSLSFRMYADDGYVAYLNGTEVARIRVTGTPPLYNTLATGGPSVVPPVEQTLDVTSFKGLLVAGTNVLAVQGHNATLDSRDLLIIPQLQSTQGCTLDAECDDSNFCTDDACNIGTGVCMNTHDNSNPCTDNIACTTDACVSGTCVSTDSCTGGQVCNPVTGLCTSGPVTLTFQQGVNGYLETVDTYISSGSTSQATSPILITDGDPATHILLRFGGIFGSGTGQIPVGSTISAATLTLRVGGLANDQSTNPVNLHRLLHPWIDTNLWAAYAVVPWNTQGGIQADGTDALAAIDATATMGTLSTAYPVSVTGSVQAWANDPSSHYGWAILPTGTDGLRLESSESTTPSFRPVLSVTFTAPADVCDDDGDCNDGVTCNGAETCNLGTGTCVPGIPVVCNDGFACTTESCVEPGGTCQFTPNHAACNDSNVCTDDACVIGTGCVRTPNTAPCSDGNACTLTDACSGGNCIGSGAPNCNDSVVCTDDSCDTVLGCVHLDNCPVGVCNLTSGVCETAPVTVTFQQGVGAYAGTQDTFLQTAAPTAVHGASEGIEWDLEDGSPVGPNFLLVQFGSIFGGGPGQIPPGAQIVSATLEYTVGGPGDPTGDPASVHEVLIDWDESVSYNTFGGDPGPSPGDEYAVASVGTALGTPLGLRSVDVTATLQDWSDVPANNHGWIFVPVGPTNNGVEARSSEYAATPSERPRLTVQYLEAGPSGRMYCALSSGSALPSGSVDLTVFLENLGSLDAIRGYQTQLVITRTSGAGSVDVPCPGGIEIDDLRADYIFAGQANDMPATNCGLTRAAAALLTGSVTVPVGTPAYLSGYTLEVSPDATAGSTFQISLAAVPDSSIADESAQPIPFEFGPACQLSIGGCSSGLECDDDDTCTTDACVAGSCQHVPNGVCSVAGTVRYYRNSAAGGSEPSTKPVPNESVDLVEDGQPPDWTDPLGTYSFPNQFGTRTVTTLDKWGTPRASDHNGAISSFDASRIAEDAVNPAQLLSVNQTIAGDVSGNLALSAFDAALVAQFSVGLIDHFMVAQAQGSDWAFLRCDNYVDASNHDCAAPAYVHDPLTQAETDDFYAILYGDVTGNWAPAAGLEAGIESEPTPRIGPEDVRRLKADLMARSAAPTKLATVSLQGWRETQRAGERRDVLVHVTAADGILALDLTLTYDPSRVRIVEVSPAGIGSDLQLVTNDLGGTHAVAAFGVLPMAGSGAILAVTVEALGPVDARAPIKVSAQANEGTIPLRVDDSTPPRGGPRPKGRRIDQSR